MERTTGRSLGVLAAAVGISLTAWTGYKLAAYLSTQLKRRELLAKYRQLLIPTSQQLQAIKSDFIGQLQAGLLKDFEPTGLHVLQLPTYVVQLPTGEETGDVYAIDLGGTNFRVMHVKLGGKRSQVVSTDVHEVRIPKEVFTGTGERLFEFLAHEVKGFIDRHEQSNSTSEPVIGFCFSFPTKQSALNSAKLLDWTKGFTCEGVIGEDPVAMLSAALQRAHRPCRIVALINDTVGVLAAHRYCEPSTTIGVIIGTGTNACYVEQLSRVSKWVPTGATLPPDTQTAINIEWGAFDSKHLPRCPEDKDVDEATVHPGRGLFEKMLSGMYLGEVARRILLNIAAETKLFGDFSASQAAAMVMAHLAQQGSFTTSHLCRVVEDRSPMLHEVRDVLAESLGVSPSLAPYSTRLVVREVCELVAARSARLVAGALDSILTHSGWSAASGKATIAFDGGVYEHFATYRAMLDRALRELKGESEWSALSLELCNDGSCLGAAVLAAAAVAAAPVPAAPPPAAAALLTSPPSSAPQEAPAAPSIPAAPALVASAPALSTPEAPEVPASAEAPAPSATAAAPVEPAPAAPEPVAPTQAALAPAPPATAAPVKPAHTPASAPATAASVTGSSESAPAPPAEAAPVEPTPAKPVPIAPVATAAGTAASSEPTQTASSPAVPPAPPAQTDPEPSPAEPAAPAPVPAPRSPAQPATSLNSAAPAFVPSPTAAAAAAPKSMPGSPAITQPATNGHAAEAEDGPEEDEQEDKAVGSASPGAVATSSGSKPNKKKKKKGKK